MIVVKFLTAFLLVLILSPALKSQEVSKYSTCLTGQCPKHFDDFIVRIRAKN